ncbi:MAG: nitroreductase [Rhodobacteraceae bacterium]|nr:nitroreductase [Paracoccaceae bacterium]
MPSPNQAAMEFLLTRRSRPARTLTTPVPTRDELMPILTAAARVPDHGKLEPWRFIVLEKPALTRLADLVAKRGAELGRSPEDNAKSVAQFADADLVVAVIRCARSTDKIPDIEQTLSAGAVCLTVLNAALASGWGANWLTGWAVDDEVFCETGLGLAFDEWIPGLIHIGTETSAPPDRPRPDIDKITTWVSA